MPKIGIGTVIKLVLASLAVGFVLALFDITPQEVWQWVLGLVHGVVDNAEALFGQAMSYILLGAVIVIPVWLIAYGIRFLKNKN